MDNRKHSTTIPVKQSERVLAFVRTHRLLFVVFAAVLVVGFAVWLTWAIVGQSTRNRTALALSELQDRGKEWKTERAKLVKAKSEREAEALLPPEGNAGLTVADGANSEEAAGEAKAAKGEQAAEETKTAEGEIEPAKPAAAVQSNSGADEIAALDKDFAVYVQQLIEGRHDDVVQVEALWWQVQLREEMEDFPGAQQSLAKIYQDYPRQPSARVARMRSANLYYQQKQDEQAIEQWDLLRAGDDGLALTAALHLGMVRTKRGEYQQARALLERFLNESADVPQSEGWQNLADSYLIALDVLEQEGSTPTAGEGQAQLSDNVAKTQPAQAESAGAETKPAPTELPGNEAKPAQ